LQLQKNSSIQKSRSLSTGGKQKKNLGHANAGFEKYCRYNALADISLQMLSLCCGLDSIKKWLHS